MRRACPLCGARYSRGATHCPLDRAPLEALPDPLPGRLLGGRYRVGAELGAGAMAVVYEGVDERTGTAVALKVADAEGLASPALRERFAREGVVGMAVAHPHCVRTWDVGHDGERAWLVLERLHGETLAARLARAPLPVAEAVAVAAQLADALATLHARGVVHRDVKPANVFLEAGRGPRAKLLDLGVARVLEESPLTAAGALVGTPRTMSPEQCRALPATPASDVYALGAVLYECLTGRPLFEGRALAVRRAHVEQPAPRVRALRPDAPEALDALVDALVAKDPAARPDARQCLRRLEALRDDEVATAFEQPRFTSRPDAPLPGIDRAPLAAADEALAALDAHWRALRPTLDALAALRELLASQRALERRFAEAPDDRAVAWQLAEHDLRVRDARAALVRGGVTANALAPHVAHAAALAEGLREALRALARDA